MTAPKDGTQRAALNTANQSTLCDQLRLVEFGSLLQGQLPQVRRHLNPDELGADDYNLSTLDIIKLPDTGKASSITRATVRAGGVTGELAAQAYGATPTTGQIAVTPCGDIAVVATDAITNMDVTYIPERGDVVDAVFPVASNAIALPASITDRGVVLLLEAESLEGTLTDKLVVLTPSGSAASTGQARLDLAKAVVKFASADAVTRARVKLLVAAQQDLCSLLEAASVTL